MAYVRIDDGAMSHPKILGLSDRAFRLWVWGLCYAQMHLTDGYLPLAAIPPKLKAAAPLLMAPNKILWEVGDQGFQIHDYGQWNDLKATVHANRDRAKRNIAERRKQDRCSAENSTDVPGGTGARNTPVRTSVTSSGAEIREEGSGEKPVTARSGRPIFTGTKFAVFEWQHTNCVNDLGGVDAAASFALDEWYHALNAECERAQIVVPKRDGGAWLQSQLVREAQRRGIPLTLATVPQLGKQTTRLAAAIANIKAEAR